MLITENLLKFSLLGAEWVMYVLLLCSLLNVALIIERFFCFLQGQGSRSFLMKLKEKLHSKEPHQDIRDWCLKSRIPAAQVVAEGLRYSQVGSPEAMEEAMTAKAIEEKGRMDWGLTILGTLGNNAPFIGLLGTVIGIIQAFHQLASADSAGPEVVMESVSEALVATGVGLFVAIPAVIAYNSYIRIMRTRMADCDASINFLLSYSRRTRNENG